MIKEAPEVNYKLVLKYSHQNTLVIIVELKNKDKKVPQDLACWLVLH